MSYLVTPELRHFVLRGTFLTPVSHHDPAQSDKSNTSLFLRRKQLLERPQTAAPTAEDVARLVDTFSVPESVAPFFADFTPAQFLAIAVTRKFIRNYSNEGLMDGVERYRRLEARLRHNAVRHATLYSFWGGLCRDMEVGVAREDDEEMLALLTMPPALAGLVLSSLVADSSPAVTLARIWNDAVKANVPQRRVALKPQTFSESGSGIFDVPAISANSIRHEMLREPAAWHLLNALSLRLEDLPDGVASLLYNGGDLNEAEPGNTFTLIRKIREAYPALGLLGGATKGFVLGGGNVEISAWLMCKENNAATGGFGVTSDVSAFDLLDREEMTRHTQRRVDGTPMPFGFEALVQGAEVLIDIRLRPYATTLEIGALVLALHTFQNADSTLGGQSARGFGLVNCQTLAAPALDIQHVGALYEQHLAENANALRQGLLDGTLTTGKPVC